MNIGKIIKSSLRYPFQDWKKIFLLGIILLISSTLVDLAVFAQNNIETALLVIIGLLLVLLVYGYSIRIIKSSLTRKVELTPFNNLIDMFISGIKVLTVGIIYFIPVILIIIITTILYPSNISSIFEGIGLNPIAVTGSLIESIMIQGVGNLVPILFNFTDTAIINSFVLIYIIVIIPLLLMAIATMADDNKLIAAFKFLRIINKIRLIGFSNLIEWYATTGILYLIMFAFVNIFYYYIGPLMLLILVPYFYIYQSRSIAQLYMFDKKN